MPDIWIDLEWSGCWFWNAIENQIHSTSKYDCSNPNKLGIWVPTVFRCRKRGSEKQICLLLELAVMINLHKYTSKSVIQFLPLYARLEYNKYHVTLPFEYRTLKLSSIQVFGIYMVNVVCFFRYYMIRIQISLSLINFSLFLFYALC